MFDNGDPPLHADMNFTITVVDKSQWPPVVSSLTITAITPNEAYPAGVALGQVHASDFDPYDTLVYSLLETQSSSIFTIDSLNGTIKPLIPLRDGTYELGVGVSDGRWTARGEAYIKIVTLSSLLPTPKSAFSIQSSGFGNIVPSSSRKKESSSFGVVMTLVGHSPLSLLSRIFGLTSVVKEAMGTDSNGITNYDVVILSIQPSADSSPESMSSRNRRSPQVPAVDILLAVKSTLTGAFVPPSDLIAKLRFALPQVEAVLQGRVVKLVNDVCEKDSCERGQCSTLVSFEEVQTRVATETLSFITPRHRLETHCACPLGYGGMKVIFAFKTFSMPVPQHVGFLKIGPRCDKIINACAHSECASGYICVPDSSSKGYACLCQKTSCPLNEHCEDRCSHQLVSFRYSQAIQLIKNAKKTRV